jgi:hypothetical protein
MTKIPHRISRHYIASNQQWIFVYSHDLAERGMLGQAFFAFAEPNTKPIYTCRKLCPSALNRYFQDACIDEFVEITEKAIVNIQEPNKPIIPFPKIGEGCSRLQEYAPKCFSYLRKRLDEIKWKDYELDYRWNSHEDKHAS